MPYSEENILRGLDAAAIMKWQKNRYPAFFVDFIDEAVPGKSADGRKCFSTNEWFFQNRTDSFVPQVIVSEALEQVFLMTFLTLPENKGRTTSTISVSAEYPRAVKAGDTLEISARLALYSRGLARGTAVGTVGDEIACRAAFTVVVPSVMDAFKPQQEN